MRREPSMFEVLETWNKISAGLRAIYANKELEERGAAQFAKSIANAVLSSPTQSEEEAIYNYVRSAMLGNVTPDVLRRNVTRIIANKHLLSLDSHILTALDDDLDNFMSSGFFGGFSRDLVMDMINEPRQKVALNFTCLTGPFAGITVHANMYPSIKWPWKCGMPKRDRSVVWSYITRCCARIHLVRKPDGSALDYDLKDVTVTERMRKYNRELLEQRTNTMTGPSCIRQFQCCTLCKNTACRLSLRDK